MHTGTKIIGAVDLVIETFITIWLYPFMGSAAWRGFPGSPHARAFLDEMNK